MTFITTNRLRRSFQKFQRQAQHVDWIPGRTGKIEPSSGLLNPNPRAGLQPNQIWVRKHAKAANDTGRGHAAVWNTTFAVSTDRADTPVWIGKDPEGEYEIKGLRNRDASNQLGAALNTVMQKIVPPELWRQLHRILNVFELRPYVRSDGDLGFKPGWINGLYWDDSSGIDPLLFATSTSGKQAWVVVYMDATGGTLALDAETGADINAGLPKNRADIETVLATLPTGAFPLFALLIRESDTSFSATDETRTEDLRDRWSGAAREAHFVPYTPDDGTHWNDPDPTSAGDGLDQLAERITEAEADIADVASDLADHEALDGTAHTAEVTFTTTGNIDDLDFSNATLIRMNNASDATIRGLEAGSPGQRVTIISVGAGHVYLAHQNAGSAAANRLRTFLGSAGNTPLCAGSGRATLVYDATAARWVLETHEQGASISYTPTWATSGTAPSLGDGTLTGSYYVQGREVNVVVALTFGSTTSAGTGLWTFSLPYTAASGADIFGNSRATDAETAAYACMNFAVSTSTFRIQVTGTVNPVQENQPFTWGTNDFLRANVQFMT